jgi:hypothetical protein
MIGYTNQSAYDKHLYYCTTGNPQCIMPTEENKTLNFKKYSNKFRHHLAIYGDFESVIEKGPKKHIASSNAFCSVGAINRFVSFHNVDEFVESIKQIVREYHRMLQKYRKPDLTIEEWEIYNSSTTCWVCNKPFSHEPEISSKGNIWEPNQKVIDHDHLTGKYVGAAHTTCNFKRKSNTFIPIFFHNLSNYDAHHMVHLLNKFGEGELKLIPNTEEKYISFSKKYTIGETDYELRFLDSYRFMPESLDELSSNLLKKDKMLFKNLLKFTTKEEQDVIFWEKI